MGKVGEEYDSGQHFGANVGRTLEIVNEQWGPWLSGDLQAEDSNDLVQQYPWYILGNDTIQVWSHSLKVIIPFKLKII